MYHKDNLKRNQQGMMEQETLLRYLQGKLPESQQNNFEETLENNPFLKDAVEGLKTIKDEKTIKSSVILLQQQLNHHIQNRKKRNPTLIKPKLWLWVLALTVLLILFIAWWQLSLYVR